MTTDSTQTARPDRPVGIVQPADPRAVRALKALVENRIKDAQANVEAIPESPLIALAWKHLLQGVVHAERREFETAFSVLASGVSTALLAADVVGRAVPAADAGTRRETAGTARPMNGDAPISGQTSEAAFDSDAMRLAALGMERIGRVRRRQDRPEQATRAHLAAYSLRRDHGSREEIWESALSLGIDADLAGNHARARAWYRAAIQQGGQAEHDPARKQAIAWTQLSASLRQAEEHAEAVAAARTARACWRDHDPGAADTARADMNLGHALLGLGELLYTRDAPAARSALREARERFSTARESLLPFGPAGAADVQWCADQIDFTNRLLTALDS